jgi:hypothetical protein
MIPLFLGDTFEGDIYQLLPILWKVGRGERLVAGTNKSKAKRE